MLPIGQVHHGPHLDGDTGEGGDRAGHEISSMYFIGFPFQVPSSGTLTDATNGPVNRLPAKLYFGLKYMPTTADIQASVHYVWFLTGLFVCIGQEIL